MTRAVAFAIAALFASPAMASDTCVQVARAIFTSDPTFPQIVETTAQELDAWPESCAATPPTGEGRVELLCRAETSDKPIYFWLKKSTTSQTLGFTPCP